MRRRPNSEVACMAFRRFSKTPDLELMKPFHENPGIDIVT
jgi:hypothetical protein